MEPVTFDDLRAFAERLDGRDMALVSGALSGRARYCTVCQKPVQPLGGFLSARRCPMCRNSGTLQKL